MTDGTRPAWLREVDNALVIAPHVVIAGNVFDFHLVGSTLAQSVEAALWMVLEPAGYEFMLVYDRIEGVAVLPRTEEARVAAAALLGVQPGEEGSRLVADLERCLRAVQGDVEGLPPTQPVALAVQQASRYAGDVGTPQPDAFRTFQVAERLTSSTLPLYRNGASFYNVCFWISVTERDLPDWFASANARVRIVSLPLPLADDRRTVLDQLASPGTQPIAPDDLADIVDDAVDSTAGMPLRALFEIWQLARRQGDGIAAFADAARAYRVGISDNPWQQEDTRRRVAEAESELSARVLGQEAAIRLSLDILTRSVTGLTGAQAGGSSRRPRGVLFFAGPTGVGKTELAKALTKVVFGSDDRYVRFDMSEFAAEHAEARLIGSPPGYVGHNSGGELTNAIRRQPFSLVLFDEIEKAHPRILDKFLQVIDDGRLTDGAGGTVYFSESILVFTSNEGMKEPLPDGGQMTHLTPPEHVEETVRRGIDRYFRDHLGRPELLNRLGGNIVVFRFLTPDVAAGVFELSLARVAERLQATNRATLVVEFEARERLLAYAIGDLGMGGRGIGLRLEQALINPLSRRIFASPPERGSTIRVTDARQTDAGWELDVE